MFGKPPAIVSTIVRLEISYRLSEIIGWINNDYSGDLLEKNKLDEWSTGWDRGITYSFDLLPHPNGVDSMFYHRHVNSFSNHLGGVDYLHSTSQPVGKYANNAEKIIHNVEWGLHHLGFLQVMVSPAKGDERRLVLLVPTSDIYQLQLGNRLDQEDRINLKSASEKIVIIDDDKTVGKVCRSRLGLFGKGVQFYNALCRVKAYIPDEVMIYNQYSD